MDKQDCDRGPDLVAWLYGEATQAGALSIEQHLKECMQCRSEATAFRYVRNSIDGWRSEMLRLPNFTHSPLSKRSAVAALREFFALAPFWLKGAVTVASIALLVLTATILIRPTQPAPVAVSGPQVSAEELARVVEERAEQRVKELAEAQAANVVAVDKSRTTTVRQPSKRDQSRTAKAVGNSSTRGPLTRAEREQLAADLRLTWEAEISDLDLLEDKLSPPED